MAGTLRRAPLRRPGVLATALLVTATHLWLGDELMEDRLGFGASNSSIRRIEVAYVRELGGNLRSIDSTVNDWPHIRTKAMVLGGEKDGPTFPEDARRAAKTLPNAELVLIHNAGHNPHEEVPERVNAELIRFLSSAGSGTAAGSR